MKNALGYLRSDFLELLGNKGVSKGHVKTIFNEIFRLQNKYPFLSKVLPRRCKDLNNRYFCSYLKIEAIQHSCHDHSSKFLLQLSFRKFQFLD